MYRVAVPLLALACFVLLTFSFAGPAGSDWPIYGHDAEAFHGRLDRIVISIDVDSDRELARRLVREHGYTFPVLNSRRLADHINFENGVPQNRIVDAQGRLLVEPVEGTGEPGSERSKP